MCLNAVFRNRLRNDTWSTQVQHKGRVQQAKLLNFLNSFYFSAFSFYFTRVLDPHPNTFLLSIKLHTCCASRVAHLYDAGVFRSPNKGFPANFLETSEKRATLRAILGHL